MTVWTVPATILRVVDADTLDVNLDLGWHITYHTKVRLAGCNAPEMNTPAGKAARDFAMRLLCDENGDWVPITVVSHSLDKYGRVLGAVRWTHPSGIVLDLGQYLLDHGHAVPM